jgi:hypothetical protein
MSALGDRSADMSQAAHIDAAGSSALATRSTLQVLRMTKSGATLTISADDLCILNSAMNEALEALGGDEDEFRTRMGTSRACYKRTLSACLKVSMLCCSKCESVELIIAFTATKQLIVARI